jgi:U3 small nucleolar ribonucleoprotein protein IMP4
MSLRRQIRLRKEFLQKKHEESQQTTTNEKKRKLHDALNEGKMIPTELVNEARTLHHDMEMDINPITETKQAVDDEYSRVGLYEPKVCITTSRDPSSRLKQFAKEIKLIVPNSQAVNRGTYRTDELVEACRKADFTDMIILTETRGQPDGLVDCHLPFGPTAYFTLLNTVLRHDIPEVSPASQAYPHLILDGLNSNVGHRLSRILQALYPVPKPDSRRVITFANQQDYISFRHHVYTKEAGKVTLKEAGPRFEMLPYEVGYCNVLIYLLLYIHIESLYLRTNLFVGKLFV